MTCSLLFDARWWKAEEIVSENAREQRLHDPAWRGSLGFGGPTGAKAAERVRTLGLSGTHDQHAGESGAPSHD